MNPTSPPPDVRDLLVERLDSLLSECDQVMDNAAHGQTIHDLDDFLLIAGKKFLQEVFQQKLQQRIEQVQQQPETKQCPRYKKTQYQNKKTKTIGSAHGHICGASFVFSFVRRVVGSVTMFLVRSMR